MSASDEAELDTALDPELADYLVAFRTEEAPPPETVEANWRAIAAQTRPARGIWLGVGLAAAAAILLVVWSPWRGQSAEASADDAGQLAPYEHEGKSAHTTAEAAQADPPSTSPKGHTEADDAAVAPELEAEPDPELVPDAEPSADDLSTAPSPDVDTTHRAPPRARTPRDRTHVDAPEPAPEPTGPSALSRETKLLREIKAALDGGDPAKALALSKEHARDFPGGAFANERQVAQAKALCALGRKDSARNLADRFVAAHPTSHLVDQMAAICRGTSNDADDE